LTARFPAPVVVIYLRENKSYSFNQLIATHALFVQRVRSASLTARLPAPVVVIYLRENISFSFNRLSATHALFVQRVRSASSTARLPAPVVVIYLRENISSSFNRLSATHALSVSRLHMLLVDRIAHLFVFFLFFVFLFFLAVVWFALFLFFLFVFLPPFSTLFVRHANAKRQTLAAITAHVFPLVFGACACFYVDRISVFFTSLPRLFTSLPRIFTSDFFLPRKNSVFLLPRIFFSETRQDKTAGL
jgi:hypothetical protein